MRINLLHSTVVPTGSTFDILQLYQMRINLQHSTVVPNEDQPTFNSCANRASTFNIQQLFQTHSA
ncbi:hypothetical protein ACJMK2_034971, partial [Sinanodonta woodiana]